MTRPRTAFITILTLALAFCVPTLQVGASPAQTRTQADFNGDGFADLAIGAPYTDAGGEVHVLYGSSGGLTSAGSQVWTQDSPGIDDQAAYKDWFGRALAAGDFDADGFSDLAIGAPGEDEGDLFETGAVHILYGSAIGLTPMGSQYWTEDTPGIRGRPAPSEEFGHALAAGDFDGSGQDDLTIGVPGEGVPGKRPGAVYVLYGTNEGLSATDHQVWRRDRPGVRGRADDGDRFGWSLTSGDFGHGPESDLAIGVPTGESEKPGAVNVLYGSGKGLSAEVDQFWSLRRLGIRPTVRFPDFGFALAAGNFGRGGREDLAVGAPYQGRGGEVIALYGSSLGLTSRGFQEWSQDSPGVEGTAEGFDLFGYALAAGDVGRGPKEDLAVGVQGEGLRNIEEAGAVNVLYGSRKGLSAGGNQLWSQRSPGVAGKAEKFEWLGAAVATGDFNNDGACDLAIGAREDNVGTVDDAGAVHVLYGSSRGLSSADSQYWTKDSDGQAGMATTGDEFGWALAAGPG